MSIEVWHYTSLQPYFIRSETESILQLKTTTLLSKLVFGYCFLHRIVGIKHDQYLYLCQSGNFSVSHVIAFRLKISEKP